MDLVRFKISEEPKAAFFESLQNFDRDYDLNNGVSLLKGFPSNASLRMSDDFPNQIALYDFLPNVGSALVGSENARRFLEGEGVDHLEFLPVQVINHKGRKAKEKYFIINLFPRVDCADQKKSKFKRNPINKEKWLEIASLVVDEKRIPPDFRLFGVQRINGLVLMTRELAEKMKAAGLRGFESTEISDFRQ